ncbi:hypothetical protein [Aquamicrobium terrae]|uniref:Flagellar FliJ protein n=1 Tax=Aquamicrobium terrae TaxID=1324945 RepID=A0ABV2N1D2_9HYPH
MTPRTRRLKKLVKVQDQLKALHEMRHAMHLAAAAAAKREAEELVAGFDAPGSLSSLFPEVYHRRIADAVTRAGTELEMAHGEAAQLATATARTNMVQRDYREARRADERRLAERTLLDLIEQKQAGK